MSTLNQELKLKNKNQELTALYEVSKVFALNNNLESAINNTLQILAKFLNVQRAAVTVLHPDTLELLIYSSYGLSKKEKSRARYRVGEGITGKTVALSEPIIVPDIGKEPLFLNKTKSRNIDKEKISFISIPLKITGKTIGTLGVDKLFAPEIPLQEDVRVLSVIASLIAQQVKINQMRKLEQDKLKQENIDLKCKLQSQYKINNFIGKSKKIQEIFVLIEKAAQSNATVLIIGESGTGKELVAHSIHYDSERKNQQFVKVDCGALSEGLLESELFGHKKGSFTGAIYEKEGKFELANKGTIFLDEISNLSLTAQTKLLRVLQEKAFEKVGDNKTIFLDVRVIAATNKDLNKEVLEKSFREDLFYRLNIFPICLPPLRERKEDIILLAEYFLQKFNNQYKKNIKLNQNILNQMMQYNWAGNIRELQNFIERIIIIGDTENFSLDFIAKNNKQNVNLSNKENIKEKIICLEKNALEVALKENAGIKARAARNLGISERVLNYKIRKYGINC